MGVGLVARTLLFRLPTSCLCGWKVYSLFTLRWSESIKPICNLIGRASSTSTELEIVRGLSEQQCPQLHCGALQCLLYHAATVYVLFKYEIDHYYYELKGVKPSNEVVDRVCVCVCVLVQSPGQLPLPGRPSLLYAGGAVPGRQRPPDETPGTTGQSTINMI